MTTKIIAWAFDTEAPGVCTACDSKATMGLGLGGCAVQLCDECASTVQEALKRTLSGSNYAKQDDSIRQMFFLKQRIDKGLA